MLNSIEEFLASKGFVPIEDGTEVVLLMREVTPQIIGIVGAVKFPGLSKEGLAERVALAPRSAQKKFLLKRMQKLKTRQYGFLNREELEETRRGGLGLLGQVIRDQTNFDDAKLFVFKPSE